MIDIMKEDLRRRGDHDIADMLEEQADEIEAAYALIRDLSGWSAAREVTARGFREVGKNHAAVIARANASPKCTHETLDDETDVNGDRVCVECGEWQNPAETHKQS